MRHSYGLTVGLHFRQPDYTRGQGLLSWLLSAQAGATAPSWPGLDRPGGHEKRTRWVRLTLVGVSLQINAEHALSNWPMKADMRMMG